MTATVFGYPGGGGGGGVLPYMGNIGLCGPKGYADVGHFGHK